ncbi:hypothetical protein pgond44_01340 [Psychroflexus gondwanensis ACAM 44]|uniref:Secreted protein n=1 Tax=Psychroflexus gondwanensis ACAM 44 TaxID=1189619 RepID=N1X3R2_9FLAO|nr:hypothetical protein [Psychroflexus gondwanensis]EMY82723.1 hypothetical protein pgond44_01340 [Psychroflexus gondwanensis ACAM 44]
MNKFLSIALILFTTVSFSQSQEETTDWITRNSDGREQVFYNENDGTLHLLAVRQAGNLLTTFVNEINPKDVKSISVKYGNDGWNSINLNFKSSGSTVDYYTVDKNYEMIGEVKSINKYGMNISIESDRELIDSFKKAYIHLFKTIGIEVKDGNMF